MSCNMVPISLMYIIHNSILEPVRSYNVFSILWCIKYNLHWWKLLWPYLVSIAVVGKSNDGICCIENGFNL